MDERNEAIKLPRIGVFFMSNIENQVRANIESVDIRLRKLGLKLVSIVLSSWMIIGSLAMGDMLPGSRHNGCYE